MKIFLFFFMFFILGALLIVSNNELFIFERADFEKFTSFYLDWADALYSNLAEITGKIIAINWMPD